MDLKTRCNLIYCIGDERYKEENTSLEECINILIENQRMEGDIRAWSIDVKEKA